MVLLHDSEEAQINYHAQVDVGRSIAIGEGIPVDLCMPRTVLGHGEPLLQDPSPTSFITMVITMVVRYRKQNHEVRPTAGNPLMSVSTACTATNSRTPWNACACLCHHCIVIDGVSHFWTAKLKHKSSQTGCYLLLHSFLHLSDLTCMETGQSFCAAIKQIQSLKTTPHQVLGLHNLLHSSSCYIKCTTCRWKPNTFKSTFVHKLLSTSAIIVCP